MWMCVPSVAWLLFVLTFVMTVQPMVAGGANSDGSRQEAQQITQLFGRAALGLDEDGAINLFSLEECGSVGGCTELLNRNNNHSGRRQMDAAALEAYALSMPRYYYCLFAVSELNKVDGVEQSFHVDATFTCYYQEPSLIGAYPANVVQGLPDAVADQLRDRVILFEPLWLNQRSVNVESDLRRFIFTQPPDPLAPIINDLPNPHFNISITPWIATTMRVSGQFIAELQLEKFPFDTQQIFVNVSTFVPATLARFTRLDWLPGFTITGRTQEVIGWEIVSEAAKNGTEFFADLGLSLPRLEIVITVKRLPDYFVNKIVIGVMFITVMSQLTYLIKPMDTNRHVGVLTAFLGIVTYLFVISNDVPKVAYLTRMDKFVNVSFYFVFIAFVLHTTFYVMVHMADEAEAESKRREDRSAGMSTREPSATNPVAKYDASSHDAADHDDAIGARHSSVPAPADEKAASSANQPDQEDAWWTSLRRIQRRVDFALACVSTIAYVVAAASLLAAG